MTEASLAKSRAQHRSTSLRSPSIPASTTPAPALGVSSDKTLLPLGALMLVASMGAMAQTSTPETTLSTVTVKEAAEVQGKDTLLLKKTTVGKGKQDIKDIPQSVTVFTEKLMTDRNQDDFREVLRTTAGVTFLAGETGEEDVRLRGFSLGQAGDIYIDGMKDAPLIERDTFNNDRVEVLKGSASMLFGKGSTGGVVNQVNKYPLLIDQHEAAYTFGTGKYHRATGDFNFVTGENAAFRLNAMVQEADNYGAKQDKRGIAPTFAWGIGTRDEFSIGLYYLESKGRPIYNHPWRLSADGKINTPLPARNFYGLESDYNNTSSQYVTLGHIHRFDDGGELNTRLRYGSYERNMLASTIGFQNSAITLGQINDSTVLTRGSKGRIGESDVLQVQSDYSNTFNWGGRKHAVLTGVDYYDDDAKRNQNYANTTTRPTTTVGTPNDGAWVADGRAPVQWNTFTSRNLGLYFQDTVSLTDTLKLVGGLRYDNFRAAYHNATGSLSNSRSDSLFSPRVGLIFQPDELTSYYMSYGTSYNTSGDTYQFGNPGATTARASNTPPEKSRNIEIGSKFELFERRALLGVAAFYSEKYNERNTDPDTAAAQELLSGKRHATGMEFNLAGRITPKWEVFFNHTWIPEAKIDRSNVALAANGGGAQVQGDRPGLTPRHSGSVWSTYAVTSSVRFGAGLTYRGKQNPEGSRAVYASGFSTIDAMVEYALDEKTALKLNVSNLTDRVVADSLYRGFYTPGAPRSVQVTLKTRF
ncbi:TonB-dependent siderophore receptor [Acidovorax carolinensis]|uniref:TonB-dependent siderophore receptor n=1 Tax=Acidovorax carolinensis TaxID=553814 RepID=A0A240UCU6_9BURK|nr:TonB-dependent siderophore receptor [Acidovorax carolinensis]ART54958.1 TonB-dependent siderophore receptor [Acidovorax carolinensis]ART59308.1 TonB-dependent siderophore receptor [Acidovorax carolinensis]